MNHLFGDRVLSQVVTTLTETGGRLRVRSALNPILWLCAIITPASLAGAIFVPDLSGFFVALGFCPVLAAVGGFAYLLLKDPSKLQSEDFQIRQQALELIKSKGTDFAVSPVQIEAISNPAISVDGQEK